LNPQNYTINIRPGWGISQVVKVSQGDVGRPLAFTIMDGQDVLTIASGTTVTIKGTKPSTLGFTQACELSGNTASVETTATMTQEAGAVQAELILTQGTTIIGSANFVMYVEPAAHPEGTTDGDAETARDLMTRAQAAVAQAEAEADRAEEAAESASQTGISTAGATAGQVPTANGAGGWSWQDQQGGGGTSDDITNESTVSGETVTDALTSLSDQIANVASGQPVPVALASGMVDTDTIYLYVGSETGYEYAHWYYYNGSAWTDGGEYGTIFDIASYNENDIYIWDDGTVIATDITLSANTMSFSEVGSQTITANLIPSDAEETVSWASSDETVATVTGDGLTATVTAVGNGSATITATTSTTALTASCAVTASGLPEEGVRYRFTGTDCTTSTTQTVGGADVTFKTAPTVEADGVLIAKSNYMLIDNADDWFADDWTMEIVFEPRMGSADLSTANALTFVDAKYGNLHDGSSSNQGQALQMFNPRDYGYLAYGGTNSTFDMRPYNNTECTIKIQYSTSGGGGVYFNGTKVLDKNVSIPSNKNIYFNAFNKSASAFQHVLKSIVIRDGVV